MLVHLIAPTAIPVGGVSDKPSDNGFRQPPTQRDAAGHRYASDLQ